MDYFEGLLDKIKRQISGYTKVDINLSLHFSPIYNERKESKNEWERFVKEYNPELKKVYDGENSDPLISTCFYYSAKLQIAGLKITAFSPYYSNPEFNQEKLAERMKKRQHCSKQYQEFLKERKEMGCIEL